MLRLIGVTAWASQRTFLGDLDRQKRTVAAQNAAPRRKDLALRQGLLICSLFRVGRRQTPLRGFILGMRGLSPFALPFGECVLGPPRAGC
jgi:hypothetical protein